MYRLFGATKDVYIQNKIVSGERATDGNTGQAGTLDLYKLYNENVLSTESGSIVEISRILIKFDYSSLTLANVSSPSFTASLKLKDVYGGQTVPSNYTLVAFPLSKSFDEGRGFDVVAYADIDTVNFESASVGVTWSLTGANSLGTLGATNIDVAVSGNLGSGLENLGAFQVFARGDEDGTFDVTRIVSASVAGILPNHGFRISFIEAQEQDTTTRFVKRFGSRHAFNSALRPKLTTEFNDQTLDTSGDPYFGVSQSFFTYNVINGNLINFTSGGADVLGPNSLVFELVASKSIQFTTSSFQANFSASITHLTRSVVYFSQSFSGSQLDTGIYSTDFMLDPTTNSSLASFIVGNETEFKGSWKSPNGVTVFASDYFKFKKVIGGYSNALVKNYVVNAVNLADVYARNEEARIRVFVQDRDQGQVATRYPTIERSVIVPDMRWRLFKSYTREEVIPYSVNTKMSTDRDGMYFDLFMEDLEPGEVYEFEFLIRNDTGKDMTVQNRGFIFKVIP